MNKNLIVLGVIAVLCITAGTAYILLSNRAGTETSSGNGTNEEAADATEAESQDEDESEDAEPQNDYTLVIFHNGTGPMCIDAIEFFDENDIEYAEYLTDEEDFAEKLNEYKAKFGGTSEGVSASFGYYPMIFVNSRAFSGFDETVKTEISEEVL